LVLHTLSLHDALPIFLERRLSRGHVSSSRRIAVATSPTDRSASRSDRSQDARGPRGRVSCGSLSFEKRLSDGQPTAAIRCIGPRSEEHTSELQSRENL